MIFVYLSSTNFISGFHLKYNLHRLYKTSESSSIVGNLIAFHAAAQLSFRSLPDSTTRWEPMMTIYVHNKERQASYR